jgi:glycosyltransferase involved in cell wall biosynthesis
MNGLAPVCVAVLAHQEERRIAACLHSLPLGSDDVVIHVIVNGSTDRTAAIAGQFAARHANVAVHDWPQGGKARSWNRLIFETLSEFHRVHVFVDGDAEVAPGSIAALAAALAANQGANAASALPLNGRKSAHYQAEMRRDHGLFGDLYALRSDFLVRMKAEGIRLPDDLIGDDGLIAALAKTDLGNESQWDDERVVVCEDAGFLCEPINPLRWRSLRLQYRRMFNYSTRHLQNRMISKIMRGEGAKMLPRQMRELYAAELPTLRPRASLPEYWFDRVALRRMAERA